MGDRHRGKRPKPSRKTLPEPEPPANHDNATPKFCLHHLCDGFDVPALEARQQAELAKTLQRLANLQWKQLLTAQRHGNGSEWLPRSIIRAKVPPAFEDSDRFLAFRYDGNLPMVGARVADVFHILWIEPQFNRLYKHS